MTFTAWFALLPASGSTAVLIEPNVAVAAGTIYPFAAAATVTPSVSVGAGLVKQVSCPVIVAPSVSATAFKGVVDPVTVTPTVSVSASIIGSVIGAAQTVTPGVTVSAVVTKQIAATVTVTPTVGAATQPDLQAAAAVTVTPAVSVSASLAAPAFDAVGTGWTNTGAAPSWSHTATAGAYVIIYIEVYADTNAVSSVTYGVLTPTLLGSIYDDNDIANGTLYMYGLAGVPGGTETVAVTTTGSHFTSCCSVSYTNVSSVGTPATVYGISGSPSPSQSVTCSAGQMISQAFGATTTYIDSPSGGTNRYDNEALESYTGLHINDATASTTFSATVAGGGPWAGIAAVLL